MATTCPNIQRIDYIDLTAEELQLLRSACNKDYTGIGLNAYLERLALGYFQLWRIGELLALTKIDQFPNGRELTLVTIAGRAMGMRYVEQALTIIARGLGCRWLSASATQGSKFEKFLNAPVANVIYRKTLL